MRSLSTFWISSLILLSLSQLSLVKAQVTPSPTLPTNSITKIGENDTIFIEGGTRAGSNLFHSFEKFSLPTGGTVQFNNSKDVQNIINRVTGSSVSNIDGLIKTNGGANLFLLNPNGIIFGSNARLSIGGSFFASTASSLKFNDGSEFPANASQPQPLLTVSVPVGLQFYGKEGGIYVRGPGHSLTYSNLGLSPIIGDSNVAGLQVQPDKTLALIGRDIVLNGGILNVPGGHIELGSVDKGLVTIESSSLGLNLDYSNISNFQNIQISDRALVTTRGIKNGPIEIHAGGLKLSNGSLIWLQNQNSQANGSLNIKTSNFVEINGSAPREKVPSGVISETVGNKNGSDINISTEKLIVQGLFSIASVTYGSGSSGDIHIDAGDLIEVTGFSPISIEGFSSVGTSSFSSGSGGKLVLSTENLIVQNGANVGTITQNSGNGGDIILSTENLTVKSRGNLGSQATGSGSGGNATLTANHLTIQGGGLVGTSTIGSGKGGDANINVNGTLEVIGITPGIFSPSVLNAATFGSGNAGNLVINTANLIVEEGGRVDTSTLSSGKAGSLVINASDRIQVSGRPPGSINPSLIDSSANTVNENLQKLLSLPSLPTGDAGNVVINTNKLIITNGGSVTVKNDGNGIAGRLEINANSIYVDNNSGITASTNEGDGGNIFLRSRILQLSDKSNISASAGSSGNGGNTTTDTDIFVISENSRVTSNAIQGRGGNIQINTKGLFLSPDSEITASSALGVDGTVQINTFDTQTTPTTTFSQEIVQTSEITSTCQPNSSTGTDTFTLTGTGGIPPNPDDVLSTNSGWYDRSAIGQREDTLEEKSPVTSAQIVEAQGWQQNSDGKIVLTAEPTGAIALTAAANVGCNQASATKTNVKSRDRQ